VKIFAKIQPKEKDDDVKDVANFRPWALIRQERGSNTIPQLISFEPLCLRSALSVSRQHNQETTLDNTIVGLSILFIVSFAETRAVDRAKLSDKQLDN
jgi:hypothetical protein